MPQQSLIRPGLVIPGGELESWSMLHDLYGGTPSNLNGSARLPVFCFQARSLVSGFRFVSFITSSGALSLYDRISLPPSTSEELIFVFPIPPPLLLHQVEDYTQNGRALGPCLLGRILNSAYTASVSRRRSDWPASITSSRAVSTPSRRLAFTACGLVHLHMAFRFCSPSLTLQSLKARVRILFFPKNDIIEVRGWGMRI